jgi:uncharacterized SAM-binding protein YcdF (DUF218 family)
MNDIVASLGLEGLKPLVDGLLLPPLPLIMLVMFAAWLLPRRRVLGRSLVLLAAVGLWLSTTQAAGRALRASVHPVPPALAAQAVEALAREASDARRLRRQPTTAIVVVGGGLRELAPEYGMSNLSSTSIERLRYGMWLARHTGLPVAYTGGIGHGHLARRGPVASEAEVATRIAEREFRLPLRWAEGRSRDTVENGLLTVPLLAADGITRIVLVTHDYHQRRALRAFERGALRAGVPLEIVPAPVGLAPPGPWQPADFLPSTSGFFDTRRVLHEFVGWLAGA